MIRSPMPEFQVEVPEVERLLNPAFCSMVLGHFILAYAMDDGSSRVRPGCPVPLSYLCLPLTMHERPRQAILSHRRDFGVHQFAAQHADALVGVTDQIIGYEDITRSALVFGLTHGVLTIDDQTAVLQSSESVLANLRRLRLHEDTRQVFRAAERLGQWFAGSTPAEVLLHLKVGN